MYVTLRRYLIQMFIRVFICLTLDINDSYKVNNERKQTLSYMYNRFFIYFLDVKISCCNL